MKNYYLNIFFIFIFLNSFSQEVLPTNQKYGKPETIPKIVKQRIECLLGINIIISYDQINGDHNCNAAEFYVLANKEKLKNINDGYTANLNNGNNDGLLKDGEVELPKEILNPSYPNVSGSRSERFIINYRNAKNIFISGDEKVTLYLECATPAYSDRGHGFGKCHSNVPEVTIIRTVQGSGEQILYKGQPNVESVLSNGIDRVALITIDSCGKLINEGI